MSKCLYLVSSSASRKYVADCLEALALPRGMVHHFRYRSKYIDERLKTLLPKRPGKKSFGLRGLPIVVVYLFQEQSGGSWRHQRASNPEGAYLPVRCGELLDAYLDGDVAHFYFQVGGYIRTNKVKAGKKRLSVRKLVNKIKFRTAPGSGGRDSYAHLGRETAICAPPTNDALAFQKFVEDAYDAREWRTRSSGAAPLDITYDIVFYRVVGIFQHRKDRLVPVPVSLDHRAGQPIARYELVSGQIYQLQVATHLSVLLPARLPGHGVARLELEFDRELIRPAGSSTLQISSAYDLEYWPILIEGRKLQQSLLRVACRFDADVDRRNFVRRELLCPEVAIPISIVPSSATVAPGLEQ